MKSLICPISTEKANRSVVRITAFIIASANYLYIITGIQWILLFTIVDFFIRAFTPLKYSPISWIALQISKLLRLQKKLIDKAPKIFAARVGLVFSATILALSFVNALSSAIVAAVLIGFALLESLFNICVGCLVYTYLVFPFHKKNSTN